MYLNLMQITNQHARLMVAKLLPKKMMITVKDLKA